MIEFDMDKMARMEAEAALTNSQTSANLESLTMEVNLLASQIAQNAVLIGRKLNEMKQLLPHGEFMPYIEAHCGFKQRMANQFMRIAAEYTVETLPAGLGVSKVYELLALPAADREDFVASHDAESMTVRQLREEIRRMKRDGEKQLRDRDGLVEKLRASRAEAVECRQDYEREKKLREDLISEMNAESARVSAMIADLDDAKNAAEAAADQARREQKTTTVEVVKEVLPADYEAWKQENAELKKRLIKYEHAPIDKNRCVDYLMSRTDDAENLVTETIESLRGIVAWNRALAMVNDDCFQWLNNMVTLVEGLANDIRTTITACAAKGEDFCAK